MIEGEYVEGVGTHVVATLDDSSLEKTKRHAEAQGFEYDYEEDILNIRVSVVDGVVYRDPDASPSAKFGDTKEIRLQITDGGLTANAPTIFSPVILSDDLERVLDQLSVEATDYAAAYRLRLSEDVPSFDELADALRRMGVSVDETEDGFVCRIDEYEFHVFPDGLAFPNHQIPEENRDIERLVNVLNEAIRR